MKLFTTLGLLVAVPLSALAFEFEKVEPEKAGFDSEKLAEIRDQIKRRSPDLEEDMEDEDA